MIGEALALTDSYRCKRNTARDAARRKVKKGGFLNAQLASLMR